MTDPYAHIERQIGLTYAAASEFRWRTGVDVADTMRQLLEVVRAADAALLKTTEETGVAFIDRLKRVNDALDKLEKGDD